MSNTRRLNLTAALVLGVACSRDPSEPTPQEVIVNMSMGIDGAGKRGHRRYDVNHVLGTGQSLANGVGGVPALTLTPSANNITLHGGVMPDTDLGPFIPLVEGDLIPGTNVYPETMSSAFAEAARDHGHDLLISIAALGGQPYSALAKGSVTYAAGLAQVTAARDLAASDGKSHIVRALTNVHGEADVTAHTATYAANLATWQSDYETDIQAITGQGDGIPFLITQVSSWTRLPSGGTVSTIPIQQLAAHGSKVVLVGPKYHLPYSDGVHLTNDGYRHMGEDYAKAYRRVVLDRGTWEPLRPLSVTRAGSVVTVRFAVPAPPLVLDTASVSDPGNYGFEYVGASIQSVALAGPDTVTITLSAAAGGRLRYAYTGVAGANAGPTTGPRGNLRDSDATASAYGFALYNWCVHFDEAVQ